MSILGVMGWIAGGLAALALIAAGLALRPDLPRADVVARYTMPDSRLLTLKDGSIAHVRVSGEGPPLVLLHGFSSSSWAWDGWTRDLAGSYQVIRIDAPGHGLTKMAATADLSPTGNAAFISEIMDQLGVARAAIAGNSMGGAQAWRFALIHPDRVTALILVDAAGPRPTRADGEVSRVRRAAGNPALRLMLRYGGGQLVMGQALRSGVADPTKITPAIIQRTDDLYRAEGNRATLLRILETGFGNLPGRLEDIRAPTLVMQGEKDTFISMESAQVMAKAIPGAKLIVYPGLGHTPHEEGSRQTAADAKAFLASALGGT